LTTIVARQIFIDELVADPGSVDVGRVRQVNFGPNEKLYPRDGAAGTRRIGQHRSEGTTLPDWGKNISEGFAAATDFLNRRGAVAQKKPTAQDQVLMCPLFREPPNPGAVVSTFSHQISAGFVAKNGLAGGSDHP
jgi:hypothetical protein